MCEQAELVGLTLDRHDIRAQAKVSAFMAPSLAEHCQSLASCLSGWCGKRERRTLEGEFALSASSDDAGHVTLAYCLFPARTGYHWELRGALAVELGQLELLERES